MQKVGFFQSVRMKFILVYILLLLIAIQLIGAYFVNRLHDQLVENFQQSVEGNVETVSYLITRAFQEPTKEDGPSLEEEIQDILDNADFSEITNLQVIDKNARIVGAIPQAEENLVGKVTQDARIKNTLQTGEKYDPQPFIAEETGNRVLLEIVPINAAASSSNQDPEGAIYLQANMEGVYSQLQTINRIFYTGTIFATLISAIIGIVVARTITRPIAEMRKQARVMATGDFSQKVNVYSGDEIGQLAVAFNDMNDKLKLAQATTEEERRKLSSVLTNMTEGVIATDRFGHIMLMNDPASNLLERSNDEVKGKSLLDVLQIHDRIDDISEIHDAGSFILDFSDDDQTLLLKASFSILLNEEEEMNGFITVLSDVTEQEKLERERREFVANVSHELRTPLTSMRSYLEALTDGAWEDKEIAPRFLNVTQTETERMIRLVNDLLQLSKMDNKDYKMYKETVDFVGFFYQIVERFEMHKSEHISFEAKTIEGPIWVWMDKDKITQVMDNIISNAIKYSPEGGTIRLDVSKKRKEQKLYIRISDEGMGIPKENIGKIFDRFYRVDKARSRKLGGTGLGLAIAREMIEAHGGNIWVDSKEGKGTTIHFTLPLMNQQRRSLS
ncbi:sensor histidine kinase [Pontibacillus halophilus JSM 076056 = DSM 19796]|uniref:histidine kinase n=1 Tax=Pontibacillus halophilus JSM 076056 = DSM 19796 TaxID=1385510 RepID=A0A0A5GRA5_9BACI|nr:cell wall metabolism sensor histidine kinase WalK [Pontibacillus halophilus]KGX93700.1 sensor histidine kinase [Pontibacillus halophilus JSM 076056 = DSM 19796]